MNKNIKANKIKKKRKKIKIVDGFGIMKGMPPFSKDDEGDSHF